VLNDEELAALRATRDQSGRGRKPRGNKRLAIVRDFLQTRSVKTTAANLEVSQDMVWNTIGAYRLVADYVLREKGNHNADG
jgi:hypothetical protein